jgi:hypothetical protein
MAGNTAGRVTSASTLRRIDYTYNYFGQAQWRSRLAGTPQAATTPYR